MNELAPHDTKIHALDLATGEKVKPHLSLLLRITRGHDGCEDAQMIAALVPWLCNRSKSELSRKEYLQVQGCDGTDALRTSYLPDALAERDAPQPDGERLWRREPVQVQVRLKKRLLSGVLRRVVVAEFGEREGEDTILEPGDKPGEGGSITSLRRFNLSR